MIGRVYCKSRVPYMTILKNTTSGTFPTGVARTLSFFLKKVDNLFYSLPSKDGLERLIEAPNLPRTVKMS